MDEILNIHQLFFPVVGYEEKNGQKEIKNIFGTSFSIKNTYFLTAGHSIKNSKECLKFGIAYLPHGQTIFEIAEAEASEVYESVDMGIIQAKVPYGKWLKWRLDKLPMLTDVQTGGYPYGFDSKERRIGSRSYKGYVVSSRPFERFTSYPYCYELSFQCPRGLSGAALCKRGDEFATIHGLIIGNAQTEMEVYREKEEIEDKGKNEKIIHTYIKTEVLSHGIAIQSQELAKIQSELLGKTLQEYLEENEMIDFSETVF